MGRLTEVAPGVLVATSSFDQTTSTVVAGSEGGALLIDPAVTVAELARFAADLRDLGVTPAVAWSTHPHWDHLLWSRDLGRVPRYATPAAAATARAERAELARETQRSAPGSGVLVAGDMCSDVEIPLLDLAAADPLGDYRTGLERLASVAGVRHVIPGHGHPGDADEFRRRLAADAAYLDALASGLPLDDARLGADGPQWLRESHEEQLRRVRGPGS